jgi:hypothetical protein
MPSLIELVEHVQRALPVEPVRLEIYEKSPNSAEAYLSNQAAATLGMRKVREHLQRCLEAIEYSDRKVLADYLSVCEFLGMNEEQIEPTVRFGAVRIARKDYSIGIEAMQSALTRDLSSGGKFLSKPENCLWVAEQYRTVAEEMGWHTPVDFDWENEVIRLGYVVSGIGDSDAATQTLLALAENLHPARCEFYVYSTEANVRRVDERFAQPIYADSSMDRGAETIQRLEKHGTGVWLAPTDGDALSSAGAMAEKMVVDRLDAVIYDTTQADATAALTASWPVARAKINWCRTRPLYALEVSTVIYGDADLHAAAKTFWKEQGVESRYLFEGMGKPADFGPRVTRAGLRIPGSAIVLASAEANPRDDFVEIVIEALRDNRQAIFLLIGTGDFSRQKHLFERAGVSKRVGYTADDGVLGICDACLAGTGEDEAEWVLKAMAWGKPVLVGEPGEKYARRLAKLIDHPQQRRTLGQTMQREYQEHFSARRMAQEIEELCVLLLGKPVAAAKAA